ncbi:MAG: hypothetical protein RBG13Loki_1746 [Promethearchaeota archaeon CR_4]|nr:MAG: hypothetical protein RBG13Loki_1746 [Candidatus Lokiarchaeota archaeon CR_4]
MNRKPLDKDLFFAKDGDIFQVITNVHPVDRVVALRKYHHITERPYGIFFWQSLQREGYFTRSIPTYDASNATQNIAKSNYSRVSQVFGVPMIEVPRSEITEYLYPDQGLQDLLNNQRETEWGQELLDIITQFKQYLNIDEKSMGITGSLLWGAQHEASDIDLVIYGSDNALRFIRNAPLLTKESSSIHYPPPEFTKRYASTLTKKTGLKLNLTMQYIAQKPYYLFYKDKFLSLGFVPSLGEISREYDAYSFRTLMPVKVKARILDDRWGYFYPGEYKIQIEQLELQGKTDETITDFDFEKKITTLFLMEREISGYYFPGDEVEIHGMLQEVRDGSQTYFQVMIGTRELYGNEWVKRL